MTRRQRIFLTGFACLSSGDMHCGNGKLHTLTATVRLGATETEATPIQVGRRNINRDGQRDLVVRFEILNTGIKCGDSSVILTGEIVGFPKPVRQAAQHDCTQNKQSRFKWRTDALERVRLITAGNWGKNCNERQSQSEFQNL